MLWWAKFLVLSAVALFFLVFGIGEMGRAYLQKNPADFLGSFFSASFIILISGSLLAGFLWRMALKIRGEKGQRESDRPGGPET